MDENARQYELVCILPPQLESGDLEKAKKEIKEIISKNNASIDFKEEKKHNLAYPVNKQRQGIYLVSRVLIAPENLAPLSKELKLNKQILRHLITYLPVIRPEPRKPKPKPVPTKVGAMEREKIKPKTEAKPSPHPKKPSEGELEEIDKKLEEIIGEI